ncbi:Photosystem II core complex protein [Nymphaea thermarum]|nr:Photosystem II core complex protein [Nymphaea thermarum]
MATMITSSILNPKSLAAPNTPPTNSKPIKIQPAGLVLPLQNLPKPLTSLKTATGAVIATSLLSPLSASAAEQIADVAAAAGGEDNRGLALLLPIIPAIGWVLFNILQPALNQLNRMRETKGLIAGVGISAAAAASGLLYAPTSDALEIAQIAEASSGDNRGLLLLFVVSPALAWVLYNILQPALNQLNRMRSE